MEYTVANVKEENRWEEGVYQIEVTDPVVGGVDGISNKQAKQLANRTKYLKTQVESLLSKLNTAQSALDTKISTSEKNAANGVAPLDANKKIPTANMPTYVVSVAGKTGAVNLSKSDVALGNVDNTSDAAKPISSAVQNALNEKLGKTEKAADSDKLDGLDSSAFAKVEQVLIKRSLPKGDYRSVGFWRTVEAGWYSYNHDSIQGSNNPSAYGIVQVLKDGDDCNILWYRKGASEIYRAGFGGSQAGNSTLGWSIITASLATGNYPNTAVLRDANGDFAGRYIEAAQLKMSTPAQDYLFTPSNEILFRQSHQDGQNWLRTVSADKFRENLKLFRLDQRNATSVYTASQANPTIDLSKADNFEITLTGSGVLTLNNGIKGQSGVITLSNAATNITGYASNIKWRTMPTSLQATETFAYFVWRDGYISIGRV